jgi:hypothetical protein
LETLVYFLQNAKKEYATALHLEEESDALTQVKKIHGLRLNVGVLPCRENIFCIKQ